MSDTQAQLDEINALLAATPNDPSLLALKDDLMQLITLEGADSGAATAEASSAVDNGELLRVACGVALGDRVRKSVSLFN